MLVACLTSLVALNGKNHAGTGNSAAFTVTQPLERAQNDAFGPPILRRAPAREVCNDEKQLVTASYKQKE